MPFKRIANWMIILVLASCWLQCDQSARPLRPNALRLVDTLVAQQWRVLESQLDSQCQMESSEQFQQAYDSILQVRIAEKEQLIRYEVQ